MELFRSALSTTRLCHPDDWPTDIDEMAALYDTELIGLRDRLVPQREFTRRPRPSDPRFDRSAGLLSRLERASAAASRRAANTSASYSSTVDTPNATAAVAVAAAAKVAGYDQ